MKKFDVKETQYCITRTEKKRKSEWKTVYTKVSEIEFVKWIDLLYNEGTINPFPIEGVFNYFHAHWDNWFQRSHL